MNLRNLIRMVTSLPSDIKRLVALETTLTHIDALTPTTVEREWLKKEILDIAGTTLVPPQEVVNMVKSRLFQTSDIPAILKEVRRRCNLRTYGRMYR